MYLFKISALQKKQYINHMVYACFGFIVLLSFFSFEPLQAQNGDNDYATIYIFRPKHKMGMGKSKNFLLYFNGVPIYVLKNQSRLIYKIYSEGTLTISNPQEEDGLTPEQKLANYQAQQAKINYYGWGSTASKVNATNTVVGLGKDLVKGIRKDDVSYNIRKGGKYYLKMGNAAGAGSLVYQDEDEGAPIFAQEENYTGEPEVMEEDKLLPIPDMSIAKEIERQKQLAQNALDDLIKKQEDIRKELEEYFRQLKEQKKLYNGVEPQVQIGIEEGGIVGGRMRYNLRATYSYEVIEKEGVRAELAHYPWGAYLLEKSAAAGATAEAMKETIENYLAAYFEPNTVVNIRIIGSADALTITNKYFYDEKDYNSLIGLQYYLTDDYQIVSYDTQIDSVEVSAEDGKPQENKKGIAPQPEKMNPGELYTVQLGTDNQIKRNEDLAFLRTYGIRRFMETQIPSLRNTNNQFLHQAKIEKQSGGKFRKVVIELLVNDILRNK